MQFGENPARIALRQLLIVDIRNSKFEIRNSDNTPPRLNGGEFRFSNFDFPLPQSGIENLQSHANEGAEKFESVMRGSTNPLSFRAKRGISLCFFAVYSPNSDRDSSLRSE
jgi:hypothetical protein